MEIWLQCVVPAQYFGAAQADVYLRARDASFALNFVKGYIGIWLQMMLVIGLGVMFSTFLSGPVAMLATLGALLGGFFNDFMLRLGTGQTYGGGPFESIIRLLTQQNVTSEMEPGLRTDVAPDARPGGRVRPARDGHDPARFRPLQFRRVRRQRLQHLRRHGADVRLPGLRLRAAGVRRRILVPEESGSGAVGIEGIRD